MTIITKPLTEKKSEKNEPPLISALPDMPSEKADVEAQQDLPHLLVLKRARAHRVSTTTTLCLLLAGLMVVGVGILGGTHLYKQYLRSQTRFNGWCAVPYHGAQEMVLGRNGNGDTMFEKDAELFVQYPNDESQLNELGEYLQEQFEIDEDEKYEKISVPDFRDGRSGRFIHDFNTNTTGIIDVTGKRCFVMPLNRDAVLPPHSLSDLIRKMLEGYYRVNTDVVRESMKVVTPPLNDEELNEVGAYLTKECVGYPVYKLEKYVGGVVKRSTDPRHLVKFSQFAGVGIIEMDIVNIQEAENFEQNLVK